MRFPKIIHLSDIHLEKEKRKSDQEKKEDKHLPNRNKRFKHVVNKLNELKDKDNHIIIITGDIVESISKRMLVANCPTQNPYIAAKTLLDKIDKSFKKVLIVPGNHDCGKNGWHCFSHIFFDKFNSIFEPFIGVPFNKFINSSHSTEIYPTCYEDKDSDALFIGLNSMEGELQDAINLLADGEIGDKQLDRLNILLEYAKKNSKKCIIYLHHHPFASGFYRSLGDNDDLIEMLELYKNNVKAVLFGHKHVGATHLNKYSIKRWYDAGSTTRKNKSNGYHKIIDFNQPTASIDQLYDFLEDYDYIKSNDEEYEDYVTKYD